MEHLVCDSERSSGGAGKRRYRLRLFPRHDGGGPARTGDRSGAAVDVFQTSILGGNKTTFSYDHIVGELLANPTAIEAANSGDARIFRLDNVADVSRIAMTASGEPGNSSVMLHRYATQMPGTATFWKRCGEATAEDG